MKEDHAGQVHWKEYGKSDKLNAIGNKNEEFRAGYWMQSKLSAMTPTR